MEETPKEKPTQESKIPPYTPMGLPPVNQLTLKDYEELLKYITEAGQMFAGVKQIKTR